MPSLVEIGLVVLEKKTFKFLQYIFILFLLFPLGNGRGSSFEQTWISFNQGCFSPGLVEIGPVVFEKKMWKVYDNDVDDPDGHRTNCDQNTSIEPFASDELKTPWKMFFI